MTSNNNIINLVHLISFLDLFAVGLTYPVLIPHLKDLGISNYVIGILGSLYSGTQVVSAPLFGAWSDVRGKKSVLKVAILICVVCYALLGLTQSLTLIFLIRFVLGLSKHTQTICKALMTELVPENELALAFGRSSAWSSVGFIIGPFLSGHLTEFPKGFMYVCLLTSIIFITIFCIISYLPESRNKTQNHTSDSVLQSVKEEFGKTAKNFRDINWRVHWRSLILRFLFGLTVGSYFTVQSLYLKEKYQLSQRYIGYTTSFFSLIGTVGAFYINHITNLYSNDKFSYKKLFHFSTLLCVCLCGMHFSPNLPMFYSFLVLFALATIVIRITSRELMLNESKKSHSGSLSGVSNSIMSVSRFCVPFLLGWFSDTFGEENAMLFGVGPTFIAFCITFYLNTYENKVKTK